MKEKQQSESIGIRSFDNIGIGVSGICMVHCLFTPVALMVSSFLSLSGIPLGGIPLGGIPLGGTPLGVTPLLEILHHWIHPVLALTIVPITLFAMWSGFQRFSVRRHHKILVLLSLGVGLIIMLTISLFIHGELHPVTEAGFSLLGGGLLVIGHWWNQQTYK